MKYKTITKSTFIDDGINALRLIKSKNIKSKKKLKNELIISKNSEATRKTCWGQINKRYLNIENNHIKLTPLIKLFDTYGNKFNKEMMFLNYLNEEKLGKKIILDYIYPRFISEGNFNLNTKSLKEFLGKEIDYFTKNSLYKTITTFRKALYDFGVIKKDGNKYYAKNYLPTTQGFAFGIYSEYSEGLKDIKKFNIKNPSLKHIKNKSSFYKYFMVKPSGVESYLQKCWQKGYLDYEPRGGLNQYVLIHDDLQGLADYIIEKED